MFDIIFKIYRKTADFSKTVTFMSTERNYNFVFDCDSLNKNLADT